MSQIKTNKDLFKDSNFKRRVYSNRYSINSNLEKSEDPSDVKIKETKSSFHYELKMPGYVKADFNFYIDNDDLTVTTEKIHNKENYNKNESNITRHSYCYPSACFKRKFRLPKNTARDKISIDYRDEVLIFDLLKQD